MTVGDRTAGHDDWTVCVVPGCGELSQSRYGRWCVEHLANYRRHGDPLESWGPGRRKGEKASPEYQSWQSMWTRCTNPNRPGWKDYGGRGITVCERWKSFDNFAQDMGERPPDTSLDRWPDNDGNYEPGNCRWATPKEQRANQRHHETVNAGKPCSVRGCEDPAYCRRKCHRHYRQEMRGV